MYIYNYGNSRPLVVPLLNISTKLLSKLLNKSVLFDFKRKPKLVKTGIQN